MTRVIHVGITDHYDPEVRAMLMSMYSRDYGPIANRLPDTEESVHQHKEKLGKFYVGYNHKSIGQCAVTDIYFESVSQLAAKAIENHPLFNGSEASTRYINFSTQPMIHFDIPEIIDWQERFRAFYIKALPLVVEKVKSEFPFELNSGSNADRSPKEHAKKVETWNNTCKARAFDICRGILPAGVTTNVGFSGTFDTLNDHFGEMLYHPSPEMKDIANETLTGLAGKYSYAAIPLEKQLARNQYLTEEHFYTEMDLQENFSGLRVMAEEHTEPFDFDRNKFEKLPRYISEQYRLKYLDFIDFGSYRDLHRHRNGYITMPLLMPDLGFNIFYYDNLTDALKIELGDLLAEFENWYYYITELDDVVAQYAVPMGYNVPFEYTCDINQTLYILELRSGKTVHQTLREVCHRWAKSFQEEFPCIAIHVDFDEENFTLKRGQQTFATEV